MQKEVLKCLVKEVLDGRMSIRVASDYLAIGNSSLGDYVRKMRLSGGKPSALKRADHSRQIMSSNFERELAGYYETLFFY